LDGLGHAEHAAVLAVAGAEGVVDVGVAQLGHASHECVVLGLLLGGQLLVGILLGLVRHGLASVEADVLKQHDVARLHAGHQGVGRGADDLVRAQLHRLAQQLAQALGAGLEAAFGIVGAVGPAQVAHEHQLAALIDDLLDAGQGRTDSAVIRDLPALEGHVEVDAHEYGLAAGIDIGNRLGGHGRCLVKCGLLVDTAPRSGAAAAYY
jgi:hypothetical protein